MSSNETILINYTPYEVRAAVMTSGVLSEIFIERTRKKSIVGNIYKGKVVKVLPGMQSAFVDIGMNKAAFLHVADINSFSFEDERGASEGESDESREYFFEDTFAEKPIEELLTEGQEIVVQVAKDATGTKGARLTMHLSIPGRYLVLMPDYEHIGVSRKIEDEAEREKLRDILLEICTDEGGLIARTVSKGQSKEELISDRDYLLRIWRKVKESAQSQYAPSLLYEDANLIIRIIRDVVSENTKEIIIDSHQEYDNLLKYCKEYHPELPAKISLYLRDKPIFDTYNVEIEINRLLDKKVWLRSGGYIIIDQTEALTVIDVNTGKFVGKRNFEETIFKTNIEAAREIAHQLKLRNIGGIIVVDFIDMESYENRGSVLELLDSLLKEDRCRASVMDITSLGLVEITRKRSYENIGRIMSEACPYCEGKGLVKSRLTISYEILRHMKRMALDCKGKTILLEAHNEIADILLTNEKESLDELEKEYNINIEVKFCPTFHLEYYELIPMEKVK